MEDATPVKKYPLRRTSGRLLSKVSEQLTSPEASTKLRKKLNVNDDQSSSPCTAGLREHQGIAANETPVRGKRRNCSSHSKQLVSPLSKGTDEKKGVPCSNKPGERPKKLTPVSTIVIFPKDSVHPHDITILNRAKTDEDKNRGKSSVKFQMVEASGQVTPWSSKMQTRKIGQSKEEFNGSPSMNRVKRKLEDDEKVGNIDDEVSEGGGNSKRKKSMEEENTLQEDVIPEEVKQSWAEQISSTEFAQCGKCSQRRKSISYITKHYLSCKVGGTGGTPSGKTRRGTQRRCSTQGIVKRNLSENDKSDKDESTECNFEEKRKLWTDKIAENGFVNCDLCNQRHSRVFRMETHYLECLKQQEKKTQKMKKDKEDPKNTDDELKDTDDATDDYMTNAKKVWASQIASDGFAKCARCCQRRNHISSMEKHHKDCLAKTPAEVDYFCPHCQRHFQSSAGLKYHMMATHNDLMSPGAGSESSEADEGNENLVLRAILRKVGKIRCQVEDCNRSFSTFAGFVYHRQRCGVKNPKKYICDKCQKEYQSQPGLKAHMLAIHPPTPPPEDVTKLNDKNESEEAASQELTATGRVRRRAAVKAVDKVQQLVKNGTVLDSLDKTSFEEMVIDWSKPLYHKPVRPLVSSEMMVQWKETIKKKGRVSCPYAGCDATYTQAPSLKGHYKICSKSGLVLEDYKCSMCDKGYQLNTQ
ncbi:uncharacterized protein LOC102804013 [Saccoglossus kowalevskii]|uniref:Uncharacterized protein LOC102804013 n=1 Tax=Saccoglossus kowalevskii TaxID=10224 RepID=A0ABM0MEA5_SACKO|nr:PREDICTED: uncharacterized protein LOC102804013 [Saccoglossus kowalevskii]